MTREEAKAKLNEVIEWSKLNRYPYVDDREVEVIKVAIKSLEQQTCEDAVSREAAIDEVRFGQSYITKLSPDGTLEHLFDAENKALEEAVERIKQLPPVNPQPKTGHWKKMVEVYDLQQNRMLAPYGYDDAKFGNTPVYVCDCGCESNKNSRFCPDCGVKMIEPQENEG